MAEACVTCISAELFHSRPRRIAKVSLPPEADPSNAETNRSLRADALALGLSQRQMSTLLARFGDLGTYPVLYQPDHGRGQRRKKDESDCWGLHYGRMAGDVVHGLVNRRWFRAR